MSEDNRIIDLDINDSTLPDFFYTLPEPINMTMCAGDGIQLGITDIEWFVTGKKGYSRETKPTTIFMTIKHYSPRALEENKKYLRSNPHLKVILLVYNHENPAWKENLVRLFSNKINNIYEDNACYASKLDLKTLYAILKTNGIYTPINYSLENNRFMRDLYFYKDYWKYFTIELSDYPNTITKNNGNILYLPSSWQDRKEIFPNKDDQLMFNYENANGLERFRLDELDDKYRTEAKAKLTNCKSDADCRFFVKNGVCDLEKNICFDSKEGGKERTRKKNRKTKKIKKTKNTKKCKKTRKN
jgi:hypothetical protein